MAVRFFVDFFFLFASIGVFLPFFGIFLKDRGYSGTEIATVMISVPAMQMVVGPVWGWLADTRFPRRALLRFALLGSVLVFPWLFVAGTPLEMTAFAVVFAVFRLPQVSMLNAAAFEESARSGLDFGKVRIGGSLGFIAFVALTGILVDHLGITRLPWVMFGALLANVLVGWWAPVQNTPRAPMSPSGLWRPFLRDAQWRWFLVGLLASRAAEAGYNTFFSVHMIDLGHPASFAGAMWALAVASEVVMMWLSRGILGRARVETVLVATYALSALRWAATSVATAPWALAVLQLTHGITFGLFYVAATAWAHEHAPEGLSTNAQGVFNAVAFGLAGIVGGAIAGLTYQWRAGAGVFEVAALLAVAASAVAWVARARSQP